MTVTRTPIKYREWCALYDAETGKWFVNGYTTDETQPKGQQTTRETLYYHLSESGARRVVTVLNSAEIDEDAHGFTEGNS